MKKSEKAVQVGEVVQAEELQDKKNKSIENSVEKNKVRQDIIQQAIEYFSYYKHFSGQQNILTLPAKHSYFEHGLNHAIERAGLSANVAFYGVEKDKKIVPEAFKNMPANATLAGYCTIEDFLKYEHRTNTAGFSTLTDVPRRHAFNFTLGWFDYCGHATTENMEHLVNCMDKNISNGLIAVTFDLSVRLMKQDKYAKLFSGYKKGMSQREAIIATIKKMIRETISTGKKIRLVNNTEYGGGTSGRTTMLTLVYSVNVHKGHITTIKGDFREGKSALKLKRLNTLNLLKYNATHRISKKVKKAVRPRKVKVVKTAEQIRLEGAVARWQGKWGGMKNKLEKKIRIAERYGVNVRQFACMVAHHHGKLAK